MGAARKAKKAEKKAVRKEKKAEKKAVRAAKKTEKQGTTYKERNGKSRMGKLLSFTAKKVVPTVAKVAGIAGLASVGIGAVAPGLATKFAASAVGKTGLGKMVSAAMKGGSVVREKVANTLKKNGKKADKKSVEAVEIAIQAEAAKKGKRLKLDKVSKSNTESAEQFAKLQLNDLKKLERQAKKAARKGDSNASDVLKEVTRAKNAAKAGSIAQKLQKEGEQVDEETIFRELEEIEVRGIGNSTIASRVAELASDLDTKTLATEKVPFLGKVIDTVTDVFEKSDNIKEKFEDFKQNMGLGSMNEDTFGGSGDPDYIETRLNGASFFGLPKKTVMYMAGGLVVLILTIFMAKSFQKQSKSR